MPNYRASLKHAPPTAENRSTASVGPASIAEKTERSKAMEDWLHNVPSPHISKIVSSLDDAIAVLENTRHAFKSPQLAALRKRLNKLRVELSSPHNYGKNEPQ